MLGVSLLGSRASAVSHDSDDERGNRPVIDLTLKLVKSAHETLFERET